MTVRQKKPIKEYALGIYDGPHATPSKSSDGPIFLGIKNITDDGRLDFSEIRHVSENEYPRWTKRVTPQAGDVVLTYEATLHRYAVIPEGFRGCLGRRVALIRPNPEKLDSRFLLYYFLSREWRSVVEAFITTGATVNRIPLEKLPDFPTSFPLLSVQKEIGAILSTYDKAIENNRRRMGLLEKAARLLYEDWFVRLRFPGHEHTPITHGLPKGWERKPLNAICPDLRESASPGDLESGTPYIGLEHMPRRSITLLEWGTAEDVTSTKLRYLAGDILFGKIRPYFHKVGFSLTDGVTSSDAIVLRPSDPLYYSFSLLTVSSDWFVAIVSKTAKEGSKMPRADWNLMERYMLAVPPKGLLKSLNETVCPMLDQLRTLAFQNQKLRAARDLLRPRLMSGEIET